MKRSSLGHWEWTCGCVKCRRAFTVCQDRVHLPPRCDLTCPLQKRARSGLCSGRSCPRAQEGRDSPWQQAEGLQPRQSESRSWLSLTVLTKCQNVVQGHPFSPGLAEHPGTGVGNTRFLGTRHRACHDVFLKNEIQNQTLLRIIKGRRRGWSEAPREVGK